MQTLSILCTDILCYWTLKGSQDKDISCHQTLNGAQDTDICVLVDAGQIAGQLMYTLDKVNCSYIDRIAVRSDWFYH